MNDQISINNRYYSDNIRFNIIYPSDVLYRGIEYNFYITINSK